MLARIRKAVTAGFGAGITAAGSTLVAAAQAETLNRETVSLAIGAGAVAPAAVGWTTWRVKNSTQVAW